MKKFILSIVCFIVAAFLFALACDLMISHGLRKMEEYRFQPWNEMMIGGMYHDVLIMGNSRGLSHFNPVILDSVLNVSSYCVAIGGYPVNGQIVKYGMYVQKNEKPKNIIYNVDFVTLNIHTFKHQHESEQFFPTVCEKYMRKQLLKNGFNILDVYCPMCRYFGYQTFIKNGFFEFFHIKHYKERTPYKGHYPEYGSWDGTELAKMVPHRAEPDAEAKQMFENFIKECKENNINVILVNSPVYSECTKKILNMEEYNTYYQNIADKYGFKYLNYTENYDLCYDTSYFCVSVHLNPEGRDIFTTKLAHDIDSLGLLK